MKPEAAGAVIGAIINIGLFMLSVAISDGRQHVGYVDGEITVYTIRRTVGLMDVLGAALIGGAIGAVVVWGVRRLMVCAQRIRGQSR